MRRADLMEKNPDAGKDRRHKGKRRAEDEMVKQCHQLSGHEFEQTLGDEVQGTLPCYSPWVTKSWI